MGATVGPGCPAWRRGDGAARGCELAASWLRGRASGREAASGRPAERLDSAGRLASQLAAGRGGLAYPASVGRSPLAGGPLVGLVAARGSELAGRRPASLRSALRAAAVSPTFQPRAARWPSSYCASCRVCSPIPVGMHQPSPNPLLGYAPDTRTPGLGPCWGSGTADLTPGLCRLHPAPRGRRRPGRLDLRRHA